MTDSATDPPRAIRFILVGGFLGAGKTTLLARLARHYADQGRRVAVVTNDKAPDAVDTRLLRAQGLHVGEFPGACFCGQVDALVETIDVLGAAAMPEIVLAEPVGSCLDMVGSVLRPLQLHWDRQFDVAPLAVVVKPRHAAWILQGGGTAGVAPRAAYIFRQQLAEAAVLLINRADELNQQETQSLCQALRAVCPETPVLTISARTGAGLDAVIKSLEARPVEPGRRPAIDYLAYAAGEAELAWLNASLWITAETPIDLDAGLIGLLENLRARLRSLGAGIEHLKVLALGAGHFAAANLTGGDEPPQLTHAAGYPFERCELVLNARVACDPAVLRSAVEAAWASWAAGLAARYEPLQVDCFRPGEPRRAIS